MAPRPRWWHQLQASKNEVLLAVDLYNRSSTERQLEAFIVHMCIGWLKLLQAMTERDGGDVYIRDDRRRRQRTKDGDWLHKPLATLMAERFQGDEPRRVNLDFFIGLRNKIEHRYERDLAAIVAGRTQALLLNYERELVDQFGAKESIGRSLRFPLFVSSITEDAAEALKTLRRRVPRGVLEWIQDFDASLEPDLAADQRFDFRIYLIPQTGPKSEADAAMSFVHLDRLTAEQRDQLGEVQTIIREKQVPVSGLGDLKPGDVVARVAPAIPFPFGMDQHTRAWRYFGVRPASNAVAKEKTKSDFCRYNSTFGQYVYTEAWVKFLIRKFGDEEIYRDAMRQTRPSAEPSGGGGPDAPAAGGSDA